MDYSKLIDTFQGIACVVSLRKSGEDGSSVVAITAANRNYLASVSKLDETFVPNRPYTYYISYDPNFEALVNTCVLEGKISHKYVNAELYDAWIDIYMLPLEKDEEGNGYCLFTYEMTARSDTNKMMEVSERTAYTVLKTCIRFSENDDFKATMDSVVKDIRSQCESDGCAIILPDQEERKIDILCFDQAGDFAPIENDVFFKPEFYKIVENWHNVMAGSNCYIISNEEELKEVEKKDEGWYKSLVYSGVRSLVLYPLRVKENLYGYIFATNFNPDQTEFIREVMELNSFVLSAEVENYRMRIKLEKMSRTDMLTGLLNRNAMNKRIEDLSLESKEAGQGLGVVFVDVNGLKRVNDTEGHTQGDEMLKSVASKLKSVYNDKEIYRAGGDEFLVIISDMDREGFYARFEQLKGLSRIEGEPTFSLGAYYDVDMDIAQIMHIADTEMYSNKAEFYKLNPDLRDR
ncbi:MAG: GGDEF domain-containing protein [Lachnospiraceae bacterium]|nr:GGDEF domain-containing protein [Lachnospiraceae bacterium]